jgi:hypothetical protein
MSTLKIVKDATGRTVGFGPNADCYDPVVPLGGALEYGDTAELSPDTPDFGEEKDAVTDYYMDEREKMIARIASIGQRLSRAGDAASAASCDAVVNGLLDMFQHPSVEDAADITAFKAALKARYDAAVALASPAAKAEFKRYSK